MLSPVQRLLFRRFFSFPSRWVSVFCDEDRSASDVFLFAVVDQFHFQFVYEIDLTVFSFAGYTDLSGAHCFHRDRCKFTDAHAGAADDLDDHGKAVPVSAARR